jgi:hypothetical protein
VQNVLIETRLQFLMVVTKNNMIFSVVILCNSERACLFRGTYHPHLQGQRVSQEQETGRSRRQPELATCFCWCIAWRTFWPLDGRGKFLRNVGLSHNHTVLQPRAEPATCFTLVSCLAYSSTLKMEVTSSSETLVDFSRCHGRKVLCV